jgi:hypothetical protein
MRYTVDYYDIPLERAERRWRKKSVLVSVIGPVSLCSSSVYIVIVAVLVVVVVVVVNVVFVCVCFVQYISLQLLYGYTVDYPRVPRSFKLGLLSEYATKAKNL